MCFTDFVFIRCVLQKTRITKEITSLNWNNNSVGHKTKGLKIKKQAKNQSREKGSKHKWENRKGAKENTKQGYVRDSGTIKRSLLSGLSIRNHLSQATSFTQWLMGLHRPRGLPHYLVHTELLLKTQKAKIWNIFFAWFFFPPETTLHFCSVHFMLIYMDTIQTNKYIN